MQNAADGAASFIVNGGVAGYLANTLLNEIKDERVPKPRGTMPGDKGSEKWGRKAGVGAQEGRRRFHDIKQDDNMSGAADDYWVDPDTGAVYDPMCEEIGNLNDPY